MAIDAIDNAVLDTLLGDATLTTLAPGRFYLDLAPEGVQTPFGVVNLQLEQVTPDQITPGGNGIAYVVARYQVKIYDKAKTKTAAQLAVNRVDALLHGAALSITGFSQMVSQRVERFATVTRDGEFLWQERGRGLRSVGESGMKILVVAPGATVSTHDVFAGVLAGLTHAGADVITYALHGRIREADRTLHTAWRLKKKQEPNYPKPTFIDVCYQSCMGLYEKGYRFNPDVVLFVSGVLIVPDVFKLMRTRHMAGVLLTESPYLMEQECRMAALCDIAWTNERSALHPLQQMQPRTHYLPHAWLPDRHRPAAVSEDVPAHDVVLVATGFKERVDLLEQVDWTGIDLGPIWQLARVASR